MTKGRLEAFSDGVIAICITIMVLELKAPKGEDSTALIPMLPTFLAYILSFVHVGIYWNNHHHLFQAVKQVNGAVLWANLHLLFWLSLVSFATNWMGESHFSTWPVAVYGGVLLMSGMAYFILVRALIGHHGEDSVLAAAIGNDIKGKISVVFYIIGIAMAFWNPWLACIPYCLVAVMWLIPDPRIGKALTHHQPGEE
ncbi:TMEM175 family protein [Zavarzinella formosa]|uniref:TMEM175 family protein n=1 Tax=Zavarzinella formosa TaxID=360055 RepID=UPI000309FE04|nr:TMEM175 family protein [Zavarzinella formosa]